MSPVQNVERVRIDRIEVHDQLASGAPRRVRASVCLGKLLPADVVVELAGEVESSSGANRTGERRRMWTAFPYYNDSFAFEGNLPDDEPGVDRQFEVVVRRPARGQPDREGPVLASRTVPLAGGYGEPSARSSRASCP